MNIKTPYLLFLGDAPDPLAIKVAQGIKDWRPDSVLGQLRLPDCQADLKVQDLSIEEAIEQGAQTLVIGVANRGGVISDNWIHVLKNALDAGLDIASGLHNRLTDVATLRDKARELGRNLFDVRHPTGKLEVGNGIKRSGKRLLPVGTDCSCGKMYTTLAIERAMHERGIDATFRATGQTGILVSGSGISVDAVVADFISGAVEQLSPDNNPDHWDIIEGQGSLYHPSFAGVTAGLIHGSQADALVLCHEPTRTHMRGLPDYPVPAIDDTMKLALEMATLTNANAKFVGFSINTAKLSAAEASDYLDRLEQQYALPAVDPFRDSAARLVEALIA